MRVITSVCLIVLLTGGMAAGGEHKGEVKRIDAGKGLLVLSVEGKEKEFTVPAEAKVTVQVASGVIEAKDGLKNEWFARAVEDGSRGYRVEVTTEKKDGKDVVVKVHLFTPTRRE